MRHVFAIVSILTAVSTGLAQPVQRPLGATVATFPLNALGSSLRELPDGRVLVVDSARRLLLLDSALRLVRVVAESPPGDLLVSPSQGMLIPYGRSGSLYLDGVRPEFAFVSDSGFAGQPQPLPRPGDVRNLWGRDGGIPGSDSAGNIVYAVNLLIPEQRVTWETVGDTAFLIAVNPSKAFTGNPATRGATPIVGVVERRLTTPDVRLRPVVPNDVWAIVDDAVVVFRASDFSVEKWTTDGRLIGHAMLPYKKIVLSETEKVRIVDSARTAQRRTMGQHAWPILVTSIVEPREVPDFLPPFLRNSAVAAADGAVWLIENLRYGIGDDHIASIVNVTNEFGTVRGRVLIPSGMAILGIGNGVVYLWRPYGELRKVRIR